MRWLEDRKKNGRRQGEKGVSKGEEGLRVYENREEEEERGSSETFLMVVRGERKRCDLYVLS